MNNENPKNLNMKKAASTAFVLSVTVALWATVNREECNSMWWTCKNNARTQQELDQCYRDREDCYSRVNELE